MSEQTLSQEAQRVYMTYSEMTAKFRAVESKGDHLTGYIIFTPDSFLDPYSEKSRTYCVSSNNKAYIAGMGGYSIYGSCLDGTDPCLRLEAYMANEKGGSEGWKIERCYCMSDDLERIAPLLKSDKSRER